MDGCARRMDDDGHLENGDSASRAVDHASRARSVDDGGDRGRRRRRRARVRDVRGGRDGDVFIEMMMVRR